ncbi:MAG: CHRD domain-containing protein [Microcystaceae cyanobacterium]
MGANQYQQATLAVGLGLAFLASAELVSSQAQAATLFTAPLSGSQENPPTGSSASGFGTVLLNDAENQITAALSFSGLSAPATVAHIHGPAAPRSNAPVLFPFSGVPGATSGVIPPQIFSITPTQVAFLKQGLLYFNVHSSNFPGGEIRGQIPATPDPSSLLGLLAVGSLGAASVLVGKLKQS